MNDLRSTTLQHATTEYTDGYVLWLSRLADGTKRHDLREHLRRCAAILTNQEVGGYYAGIPGARRSAL